MRRFSAVVRKGVNAIGFRGASDPGQRADKTCKAAATSQAGPPAESEPGARASIQVQMLTGVCRLGASYAGIRRHETAETIRHWRGLPGAEAHRPKAIVPVHLYGHPADMTAIQRLAVEHAGEDVVIVSHGGAIRAAVAHALRIPADNALHLSIQNLSLTRLERHDSAWRIICVNELSGY